MASPFMQRQREKLKATAQGGIRTASRVTPPIGQKVDPSKLTAQQRYDHYTKQITKLQRKKQLHRDGSIKGDLSHSVYNRQMSEADKGRTKAMQDLEAEANNPGASTGNDASKLARGSAERPVKRRRKGRAALRIDAQTGGVKNDGAGAGVNVPQK